MNIKLIIYFYIITHKNKNNTIMYIMEQITQYEKSILAIWRKKVDEGTPVYITLPALGYLEGVIEKISQKKGYAVLKNARGRSRIPLTTPIYIEVLSTKKFCTCEYKNDNKYESKNEHKTENKNISTSTFIWASINIGDRVFIQLESESFAAKVVEIDFQNKFVGLGITSGIIYLPFDDKQTVTVLCDKKHHSSK
jgi:hypothetical protein